jgi:hypothetical protein
MSFELMHLGVHPSPMTSTATPSTAILAMRPATAGDAGELIRLSALDSRPVPRGDVLMAIVDGEPVAAVEVATGAAIADPFRPTADLVDLLRLRARLLTGTAAAPRGGLRQLFSQRPRVTSTA